MSLLIAAAFLSGCYSWRAAEGPTADPLRNDGPREVRVWRSSSEAPWELEDATVREDSLVGSDGQGRQRSVALSDVQRVEVRELSVAKTALLAGGVALLAYGTFLVVGLDSAIDEATE